MGSLEEGAKKGAENLADNPEILWRAAHSQARKQNGRDEQTDCRQQRNTTSLPLHDRQKRHGERVPRSSRSARGGGIPQSNTRARDNGASRLLALMVGIAGPPADHTRPVHTISPSCAPTQQAHATRTAGGVRSQGTSPLKRDPKADGPPHGPAAPLPPATAYCVPHGTHPTALIWMPGAPGTRGCTPGRPALVATDSSRQMTDGDKKGPGACHDVAMFQPSVPMIYPFQPSLGCPLHNCKSTAHSCMIGRSGGEGPPPLV